MIFVLDSSAILAYIFGETGANAVNDLLTDPSNTCYAHAINLCEVYYTAIRRSNEQTARKILSGLSHVGVIEREDMGRKFWERVGELKSRGRISLADCFCIVLAEELSGEVVTSDHKEFEPFVPLKICPIRFIR